MVRSPGVQAGYGQSVRVAAQSGAARRTSGRSWQATWPCGCYCAPHRCLRTPQRCARGALLCAFGGGVRTSALAGRSAAMLRMVPLRGGRCLVGFILCDALLRVDMSCSL